MYTFRDIPSPPKNMAYPIIHFMYTFVKMLIKIDNPSEQTVVVVYMESIQDDVFLRNSKDIWHIYICGYKKQEKDIQIPLVNGLPCKGL